MSKPKGYLLARTSVEVAKEILGAIGYKIPEERMVFEVSTLILKRDAEIMESVHDGLGMTA